MEAATIATIVDKGVEILRPLVSVLIGVAMVYFIYGVVIFISSAGDESKREEGKKTIGWGLLALFIMVSVW